MPNWIRGVNLGGWLVLERFITPYLFAITSCHLQGDFCYYPGQIDAPSVRSEEYEMCDFEYCKPILETSPISGELDFPVDEYSLLQKFEDVNIAARYLEGHYDRFVTRQDVAALREAGVTHVRVPLPHWILTSQEEDEPWVSDIAWLYFARLVGWCRKEGIQVWPDLHTAPGSQNGFDNSGQLKGSTCKGWSDSPINVNRTLESLDAILKAVVGDGLEDVVTGVGILNEPFSDCDMEVVRDYNNRALHLVRTILANDTAVFVGDMFNATLWNDGWWQDTPNTYLDSHYYHVFAEKQRELSPRQHIAYLCQHYSRETTSCCYEDTTAAIPAKGISRLVGEWSASYDTLPVSRLTYVMEGIRTNGTAPYLDRTLSLQRREFLKNFVEAQMVTYEAANTSVSSGWFYWTMKMEGGAFAEWDFLRGIQEGWIPKIPAVNVSSVSEFGTCDDIIFRTDDNMSIIHEYPPPDPKNWQGPDINDDVVISHGDSLLKTKEPKHEEENEEPATVQEEDENEPTHDDYLPDDHEPDKADTQKKVKKSSKFFTIVALAFFGYAVKRVFLDSDGRRRSLGYHTVDSDHAVTMAV